MCWQPAILLPSVNFLLLTPYWTSLGASSRQGDLVFAAYYYRIFLQGCIKLLLCLFVTSFLCLQVNWTPKVAKDIIKQGILPDVKVIVRSDVLSG